MSHITTHVLDTSVGRPAAGIVVVLEDQAGTELARGTTNADGRVADLGPDRLSPGTYRLRFITGPYLEAHTAIGAFYPEVILTFSIGSTGSISSTDSIASAEEHYHIPLLLSPFGYSTYRGS